MALYRLLIARFLFHIHEKSIQTLVRICFISIALSAGALTLVSAIMNGFEHKTRTLIQSIHPEIIISGGAQALKYSALKHVLTQEYGSYITGISSRSQAHALIQDATGKSEALPILIIAIEPETEPNISGIPRMAQTIDNIPLTKALSNQGVLVGTTLAHQLGGTFPLKARITYRTTPDDTEFTHDQITINGSIKTGVDEFDTHVVLMRQDLFNEFFPTRGITQVGITSAPTIRPQQLVTLLAARFPSVQVYAWYDMYPALLSALTLERYAMFLILILIILVASMNIVALLSLYLHNKRTDIAVLRALGTPSKIITAVFTGIGMSIAITASLVGMGVGALLSFLIDQYQLIKLPEAYYVSHVPAYLDWPTLLAVTGVLLIISFFASYLPSRHAQKLPIPLTLRQLA